MPPAEAWKLADDATGGRFSTWAHLTVTDIGDISERLARAALDTLGVAAPVRREDWPDTWPRDWPSRRSTNLRRP
ncbi:MAG TPA: hypothetical protein VN408_07440 [Actinoplanes sp.]|nr:hypothetical protein [Actinoplanes sp.]